MNNEQIISLFRKSGITEVGFTDIKTASKALVSDASVFGYKTAYSDISDILPGAESVIVYLVPYNNGAKPKNLSMYATGTDYHVVCNTISENISTALHSKGYECISFSDNGPLRERTLAHMAGLGIIGENGFLINEKYGSYTFIGYIITTCPLTPSEALHGNCIKCGKCINSCPGKALTQNKFEADKCISYITQKKGELTQAEKMLIKKGNSAWGCDICQNVCPMNTNVQLTELKEFKENVILCINNEYLSNKEFKEKYSNRAFTWRGKAVIYRNLSILNNNND